MKKINNFDNHGELKLLTAAMQESMVAEARVLFSVAFPDVDPNHACLYWAVTILDVARRRGLHLALQAGNAHFLFDNTPSVAVDVHQNEDGTFTATRGEASAVYAVRETAVLELIKQLVETDAPITHLSYVWQGAESESVKAALEHAKLPEMHVWAGDPKRNMAIDLSTFAAPAACKSILGVDWTAPKPPDYLWSKEAPDGWHYEPKLDATKLAGRIAGKSVLPRIFEARARALELARSLKRNKSTTAQHLDAIVDGKGRPLSADDASVLVGVDGQPLSPLPSQSRTVEVSGSGVSEPVISTTMAKLLGITLANPSRTEADYEQAIGRAKRDGVHKPEEADNTPLEAEPPRGTSPPPIVLDSLAGQIID